VAVDIGDDAVGILMMIVTVMIIALIVTVSEYDFGGDDCYYIADSDYENARSG
jgi:hypothetical protein